MERTPKVVGFRDFVPYEIVEIVGKVWLRTALNSCETQYFVSLHYDKYWISWTFNIVVNDWILGSCYLMLDVMYSSMVRYLDDLSYLSHNFEKWRARA